MMKMKFIYIIFLQFLIVASAFSQAHFLEIETSVSANVVVCAPARTFTIRIKNNASQPVTDLVIQPNMKLGVNFKGGLTGATLITDIPSNNPKFSLASIAAGQTAFVTFQADADCRIISYIKQINPGSSSGAIVNNTRIDYKIDLNNYFDLEVNSPSYNVVYADMDVSLAPIYATITANIGDIIVRKIRIRNTGFGELDTLRLKVTLPAQHLYSALLNNGIGISPLQIGPDFIVIELTDFSNANSSLPDGSFGDGDGILEKDEIIVITEQTKVISCTPSAQTDYLLTWGCYSNNCNEGDNDAKVSAFVNVPDGEPGISVALTNAPAPVTDYCAAQPVELFYSYTNSGTTNNPASADRATNLRIKFSDADPVSVLSDFKLFDNASNQYIPIGTFGLTANLSAGAYYITFNNNPAVQTDIDGPGGLDDLDKDGYFDDLPSQGVSIKMSVNLKLNCPASVFNSCALSYDNYLIRTRLEYSDGCYSYENKPSEESFFRNYNLFGSSAISGPRDLVQGKTGSYTLSINRNYGDNGLLSCTANPQDFVSEITLPGGYTVNEVRWNHQLLTQGSDWSVSSTGILTILFGDWTGQYDIKFSLVCDPLATYNTIDALSWKMFYQCGSCACRQTIACVTYSVQNHCPSCDGFHTTSFDAERRSFGWVEPGPAQEYTETTWKAAPKVNESTPGIALDKLMLHDTFVGIAKGFLSAGTFDKCFVEFSYNSGNGDLFEFISAEAEINGAVCSQPVAAPVISVNSITHTYTFEIPALCKVANPPGPAFVAGDQVNLRFYLRVKPNSLAQVTTFELRARHLGQNAQNAKIGCESFGDNISVCVPYDVNFASGNNFHCAAAPAFGYLGAYPPINGDMFPNEFRPFFHIDSIWVNVPVDYHLIDPNDPGNVYHTLEESIKGLPGVVLGPPDAVKVPFPGAETILSWSRKSNWPVGEYHAPFSWSELIRIRLKPNCKVGNKNIVVGYRYSKYDYTDDPNIIQHVIGGSPQWYGDVTQANLSITPDAIQEGYTREVKWPIRLCDINVPGKSQNASNSWIAVEPKVPGIIFQYAQELDNSNNVIATYPIITYGSGAIKKGMFQVGDVNLNTCRQFILVANYFSCVEDAVDTINVFSSWSCHGYPTEPSKYDCANDLLTSKLFLRYKTAGYQVISNQLGDSIHDICDDIPYEFDFLSTKFANMTDIKLWMELPAGISQDETSIQIEYPDGMGFQTPDFIDNLINDGKNGWDISSFLASSQGQQFNCASGRDLPGNRSNCPNKNLLKLRLNLQTDCSFDPGLPVRFFASGKTNCNDLIELPPFQYKVRINGLDPLDKMFIDVNATAFNDSKISTVTVFARNNGTANLGSLVPSAQRYIRIVLPAGVVLDQMLSGSPAPDLTIAQANGGTAYYWLLPGLAPGASQSLSFTIKNNSFNAGASCNQLARLPVNASTIMRNTVTCSADNQPCTVEATTAADVVTIPVSASEACKDCISSFAPLENHRYILSAWVKQANAEALTTYKDGGIMLYFEGSNLLLGPVYPAGEIIDGWQRVEYDFTVPPNSTTIEVRLANKSPLTKVFFDDIRIHPFNSNMKSFVYDPVSLRLWATLDENNYATFYEYDEEGALIRVKKETEKGVKTIQESRNNTVKKP
jgi:hypothetical protein